MATPMAGEVVPSVEDDNWHSFSFPINEPDPFPFRNPHQVLLQLQDLKRGAVVDLNDGVIGDLLMLCQFPFPVFFDDLPDFVHFFDHEHVGIPEIVFGPYPFSCRNVLYFV